MKVEGLAERPGVRATRNGICDLRIFDELLSQLSSPLHSQGGVAQVMREELERSSKLINDGVADIAQRLSEAIRLPGIVPGIPLVHKFA